MKHIFVPVWNLSPEAQAEAVFVGFAPPPPAPRVPTAWELEQAAKEQEKAKAENLAYWRKNFADDAKSRMEREDFDGAASLMETAWHVDLISKEELAEFKMRMPQWRDAHEAVIQIQLNPAEAVRKLRDGKTYPLLSDDERERLTDEAYAQWGKGDSIRRNAPGSWNCPVIPMEPDETEFFPKTPTANPLRMKPKTILQLGGRATELMAPPPLTLPMSRRGDWDMPEKTPKSEFQQQVEYYGGMWGDAFWKTITDYLDDAKNIGEISEAAYKSGEVVLDDLQIARTMLWAKTTGIKDIYERLELQYKQRTRLAQTHKPPEDTRSWLGEAVKYAARRTPEILSSGEKGVTDGEKLAEGGAAGIDIKFVAGFASGVHENTYMISVGTMYCALRDAGVEPKRAGDLAPLLAVPHAGLPLEDVMQIPVVKKMLGDMRPEMVEEALKDPTVLKALERGRDIRSALLYEEVMDKATGLGRNAKFYLDWELGTGDTHRSYGTSDRITQQFAASSAGQHLRNEFYKRGAKSISNLYYKTVDAGIANGWRHWDSSAQIGGVANVRAINNGDGTVTFIVPNTAGQRSWYAGQLPNREEPGGEAVYRASDAAKLSNPLHAIPWVGSALSVRDKITYMAHRISELSGNTPRRSIYQEFRWTETIDCGRLKGGK